MELARVNMDGMIKIKFEKEKKDEMKKKRN